jgi:hypothetical protein
MKKISALAMMILMGAVLGRGKAQTVPSLESIKSRAELTKTIATLDTEVFDAYNTCDLEKFSTLFAEDVEFYHDLGGLSVGRKALVEGVKNNICGKVTRALVPGSMEVYPIKGFGAVEIGVHRFLHP